MVWDIQKHDLGGIEAHTVRNADAPVVEIQFRLRNVGAMQENNIFLNGASLPDGTAHFFEHLPFSGTEDYPGSMSVHAAAIGANLGAWTGLNDTQYEIRAPKEHAQTAMKILASLICRPALKTQDVIDERDIIAEEMRWRAFSYPLAGIYMLGERKLLGDDPRYKTVIGNEPSIRTITRDHLVAFREPLYVRQNGLVVMTGDMSHDDMKHMLLEGFAGMPHGAKSERPQFAEPVPHYIHSLAMMPGLRADLAWSIPMDELNFHNIASTFMLGAYFSRLDGPVMQDIREAKRLVYAVEAAGSWSTFNFKFSLPFVSPADGMETRLATLLGHAKDIVTGKVNVTAFEAAKQVSIGHQEVEALAAQRTGTLGAKEAFQALERDGKITFPQDELDIVRALTPDNIVETARRVFSLPTRFFAFGDVALLPLPTHTTAMIGELTDAARATRPATGTAASALGAPKDP